MRAFLGYLFAMPMICCFVLALPFQPDPFKSLEPVLSFFAQGLLGIAVITSLVVFGVKDSKTARSFNRTGGWAYFFCGSLLTILAGAIWVSAYGFEYQELVQRNWFLPDKYASYITFGGKLLGTAALVAIVTGVGWLNAIMDLPTENKYQRNARA